MNLKLFYRPTCPYCAKVLNYINENDLTLNLEDISKSEDALKELITVGGKQQVPCLFIDGKPLYESNDIINWLKENA